MTIEFAMKGTPLPPLDKHKGVLLPSGVEELKAPSVWMSRIDGHQWKLMSVVKGRAQLIGPALVDLGEWGGMVLTMPLSTLAQQYEWVSNEELSP